MNRKQRRGLEKQVKQNGVPKGQKEILQVSIPPIAPLTPEQLKAKFPDMVHAFNKWEENIRMEAANRALNLTASAFMISLSDKYDFNTENLNKLLEYAFTHMECAWQGYVTYEELMTLCEELGVPSKDLDFNKVQKNIRQIREALYAHEQFKREWQDIMSMKDKIFKLLDQGIMDKFELIEKTGLSVASVANYKWMWKKEKGQVTAEDLEEALFPDDGNTTEDNPVEEEVVPETTTTESVKEFTAESVVEEAIVSCNYDGLVEVIETTMKQRRLKAISMTLQGEFGTYKVESSGVNVILDTADMSFEKCVLQRLVEELQEVLGNMK